MSNVRECSTSTLPTCIHELRIASTHDRCNGSQRHLLTCRIELSSSLERASFKEFKIYISHDPVIVTPPPPRILARKVNSEANKTKIALHG